MKTRIFIFDLNRCFGCHGCVAACANVNHTPPGVFFRQLLKLPPEEGRNDTLYISLSCNHCSRAPCVRACPSGSLQIDSDTGAVVHNPDLCLGCRYCQMSCPYDAIRYKVSDGVIGKCDFCNDRLKNGQEPACVETCFSGALRQAVIDTADQTGGYGLEAPGFTFHADSGPSIRFINPVSREP